MGGDPKVASVLQYIKREIQEICVLQQHGIVRLGRIERQLQTMHQVDIFGSIVKDLAPIESPED